MQKKGKYWTAHTHTQIHLNSRKVYINNWKKSRQKQCSRWTNYTGEEVKWKKGGKLYLKTIFYFKRDESNKNNGHGWQNEHSLNWRYRHSCLFACLLFSMDFHLTALLSAHITVTRKKIANNRFALFYQKEAPFFRTFYFIGL